MDDTSYARADPVRSGAGPAVSRSGRDPLPLCHHHDDVPDLCQQSGQQRAGSGPCAVSSQAGAGHHADPAYPDAAAGAGDRKPVLPIAAPVHPESGFAGSVSRRRICPDVGRGGQRQRGAVPVHHPAGHHAFPHHPAFDHSDPVRLCGGVGHGGHDEGTAHHDRDPRRSFHAAVPRGGQGSLHSREAVPQPLFQAGAADDHLRQCHPLCAVPPGSERRADRADRSDPADADYRPAGGLPALQASPLPLSRGADCSREFQYAEQRRGSYHCSAVFPL